MSLGQTIARLRTERRLSQGELADALGVSRQSISKWETDSSVPELDKLIRLSRLFDVTLDELVLDQKAEAAEAPASAKQAYEPVFVEQRLPPRRVAGVVFLCMSMMLILIFSLAGVGGALAGLVFSLPLLCCSLICFLCAKRTALWCAWGVYLLVALYLRYATGVSWHMVRLTAIFTPEMNYIRLGMAWVELGIMLILLAWTLWSFRRVAVKAQRRNQWLLIGGWLLWGLLGAPAFRLLAAAGLLNALYQVVNLSRFALFAAVLNFSAALWRGRQANGDKAAEKGER